MIFFQPTKYDEYDESEKAGDNDDAGGHLHGTEFQGVEAPASLLVADYEDHTVGYFDSGAKIVPTSDGFSMTNAIYALALVDDEFEESEVEWVSSHANSHVVFKLKRQTKVTFDLYWEQIIHDDYRFENLDWFGYVGTYIQCDRERCLVRIGDLGTDEHLDYVDMLSFSTALFNAEIIAVDFVYTNVIEPYDNITIGRPANRSVTVDLAPGYYLLNNDMGMQIEKEAGEIAEVRMLSTIKVHFEGEDNGRGRSGRGGRSGGSGRGRR